MKRFLFALSMILMAALAMGHDLNVSSIRLLMSAAGGVLSASKHQGGTPLRDELKIEINGRMVPPSEWHSLNDSVAKIEMAQFRIPMPVEQMRVLSRLQADKSGATTVVSVLKEGKVVSEEILNDQTATWTYGRLIRTSPCSLAARFMTMGVGHILSGPDHLLFLLGLLLAIPRFREILKIATAFTVAHGITLFLCAFGLIHANPRWVEPLIALSISAVAMEAWWHGKLKKDLRWLIAFGFGLVHGCGFAGAILDAKLPTQDFSLAVISFNVGIEVVQIALIATVLPVLKRLAQHKETVQKLLPIAVGSVGLFWFFQRLLWS